MDQIQYWSLQVLSDPTDRCHWKRFNAAQEIPVLAVAGGIDDNGHLIYVGRGASIKNPGGYVKEDGMIHIPSGGRSRSETSFDLFMCSTGKVVVGWRWW